MELVKVEGYEGLAKDCHSKAVINTDRNGLAKAKLIKQKKLEEVQRIADLNNRVTEMENKLDLILKLLTKG